MGLAHQTGNTVTLSYRQERFARIKARNEKRIDDCIRAGKINVIFNSQPVEFKPETVVLDVKGERREIPNDFAWIFAGGVPPKDFLQKIGIEFGMRDMTVEAGGEAKREAISMRPSPQRSLSQTLR
jgi:thioredoxin reductase